MREENRNENFVILLRPVRGSDSLGVLDLGSQVERVNSHCETGFPDVHLSFLLNGLGGQLDSAINNPESNETKTCSQSRDLTRKLT